MFGGENLGKSLVVYQILTMCQNKINKEANKQEFIKFYLPNVSDGKIVIEFSSIKCSCYKAVYNFIHKSHFCGQASRHIGLFSYAPNI